MKTSVGRIVHYQNGGQCLAAIVVQAFNPERPTLRVMQSGAPDQEFPYVEHADASAMKMGTWHYPERVEES